MKRSASQRSVPLSQPAPEWGVFSPDGSVVMRGYARREEAERDLARARALYADQPLTLDIAEIGWGAQHVPQDMQGRLNGCRVAEIDAQPVHRTRSVRASERWYVPADPARPRSPALVWIQRAPGARYGEVVVAFTTRQACEAFALRWLPAAAVFAVAEPQWFVKWVEQRGYLVVVDLEVNDDGSAPSYWTARFPVDEPSGRGGVS